MFMRKSIQLLLICSLLGMVLSSCSPVASSGTVRKKYKQDINRVQWSPDGQFLVFEYSNNIDPGHSYAKEQTYAYQYKFNTKNINLINSYGYACFYTSSKPTISYLRSQTNPYTLYESDLEGNEKVVSLQKPIEYPQGLKYMDPAQIILFENVGPKNRLLKLNRSTQEITPIEPDESVQKFIQEEKISDYEIKHVFERNGILRLVLQASHKVEGLPANEHPPVTYATALLQESKITQIEKLYHLEKPFGVDVFFWGLSPDNKLIFGTVKNLPPLEYFEYDYEKHQRNPRPDLNKINDHLKDGRILKPEAFSPDFTKLVYILARSEDRDKNPIRDFILLDLKTGKEETLFNINTTFPKGDFTWSY
ncbi:hypothetical protein COW20_21935 [bacterium (Candidatus Blackallbacteria) CG13_big_fil_rev_8_21_14_2_50_49_14]|nr:MAG: hypothetical protein COW64_19245 [bacterium (Candidatus Blackallbacteria) CG18_big_fil_WC_8_21_14_2_50_49_26]PIW45019.1 MAG: hypothetical protein COW20_21935 [bacterium (Candidatus Blackallbacteria) CG13_big_fil_rev_8_21_14_2_50_49_14]